MAIMTAEEAVEYGRTLTFEKVWAALMEVRELHKETEQVVKEVAAQQKETAAQHKETERYLKEKFAETERVVKEVMKTVGEVHNSVGELVETLVSANIWKKFGKFHMERVYQRVSIYDENNRCVGEIDSLISNTTHAVAAEVKRRLKKGNVDFHLKRLELIRKYPPAEVKLNNKILMGAVAGGTVPQDVRDYAHENGLFVIELSGEAACLVEPPDGFEPREWK
jgi:hypothetical protein